VLPNTKDAPGTVRASAAGSGVSCNSSIAQQKARAAPAVGSSGARGTTSETSRNTSTA